MSPPPPAPDLQAALARTAAFGLSPDLRFAAQSGEEAIVFLLDQVKTCQLPRRLTLSDGHRALLRVDAAGGRLLALVSIGEAGPARAFADVLDRPLNARSETDAGQVADCLQAVLPAAVTLTVTTARPEGAAELGGSGLAPAQVLQALGFVPASPDPSARYADLIAAAEDVLVALYAGRGETRHFRGEAALPDPLTTCLDRLLADPAGLIGLVAPGDILVLTGFADLPHGIALLHAPDGPAALVFEGEAGADLAAFWAEVPLAP
ncbi:MAG: hypothetical protein EP318_04375 [Rhodobacteraceae bacterium]|nr:MAG: hypothetical protein EP318_04375 [Paracoccaceae bacterium]